MTELDAYFSKLLTFSDRLLSGCRIALAVTWSILSAYVSSTAVHVPPLLLTSGTISIELLSYDRSKKSFDNFFF